MNRISQALAAAFLLSLFAGCRTLPVIPPGEPVDVRIVSMRMKPQHPLPGERWRAVMVVVNHSDAIAKDIAYIFRIPDRNLEIGRGHIGKMLKESTLDVSSDDVQLPAGEYRVEAQIFLPTREPQCVKPTSAMMTVRVGQ
jgi:hypothetical protein